MRLPGICNWDRTTVVLAHINRGGVGGMGMKAPDVAGVFACSACHDVLDGRQKSPYRQDVLDGYIVDAMCRQLKWWVDNGYLGAA